MRTKPLHLTLRHALRQYKRYKRKFFKLQHSAHASLGKMDFLKKRIERLRTFLKEMVQKAKLATAAGALALVLSSSSASAQTFLAPVNNPFGINNGVDANTATFGDLDGDGDLDMLSGSYFGGVEYYVNSGSATAPAFNAPITISSLNSTGQYSFPAFCDLDNDGDLDVMMTNQYGEFHYYKNTGTPAAYAFTYMGLNPFGLDYTNSFGALSVGDLDNDGDLDMLVGTGSGNFQYFVNSGTATAPDFSTAAATNPFNLYSAYTAVTPALVDIDGDGDLDIVAGEVFGGFLYYENTGTPALADFATEAFNSFGLASISDYTSTAALVDLDADGDLDLMSGSYSTGFYYFEQDTPCTAPVAPTSTTVGSALSVCSGDPTTLTATGTGTLSWYTASTGGTYLGSGGSFVTPAITGDISYYVQDSTCAESPRTEVAIEVNPLPTVGITVAGGTTICEGETITLSGTGAVSYQWAGGPATQDYTVSPLAFSSYSVTGTDAIGCQNSAFQMIIVNSLPDVTTTIAGPTITANLGGATYQWLDCNNAYAPISGETGQSFTATADGDYALLVDDGNCADTSHCENIVITGLSDLSVSQQLSVYPNPSNGSFTIQSPVAGNFVLLNEMGQVIQTIQLNAGNANTVRIEGLANGIYFVTGVNNQTVTRQKIVVTK